MKITDTTLMVNFTTTEVFGTPKFPDAIEVTLHHIAFIQSNDRISLDLSVDITDMKFLGKEIKDFKIFKSTLSNLGFELNKLIDEKLENEEFIANQLTYLLQKDNPQEKIVCIFK